MSFESRSTEDLMRIASTGGGYVLDAAARSTEDLLRISFAAKQGGARLILRGMESRPTNDLMRIGAAGGGAIQFEG